MNRRNTYQAFLCCVIALFSITCVQAKVKLPRLISDGMVLQRDTPLKFWGWASAGEKVKVTFQGKSYTTKANAKGDWHIELPSYSEGGPYTLQVNDVELKDILIGDVWLCSGQSNMELPVRRVLDLYQSEVETANRYRIRLFRVPMHYNFTREEVDLKGGEWKTVTPETILDFSATAYFFADELYNAYNVPIGLINTAIGGSPAEAWLSEESLKSYPRYLESARLCATPGYVDSVKKADSQRNIQWQALLDQKDEGISLWNRKDFDDSGWALFSLPGYWADKGIKLESGSLWIRKDIDLPSSMAGKPGVLRLGRIIDADSAFINGVFVGTVSYQYPPRIYTIPEGLLKEGRNNITVRVISTSSFVEAVYDMGKDTTVNTIVSLGGFVEEKPYKIIVDKQEIDITGDWKYRVGATMPPAAPQTFFQYKPMGLYNGMIAPLKWYALKGVLWYQGEANTNRSGEYKQLLTDLIGDWRNKWNNRQLPFIYAQLPNFMKEQKQPAESKWAELREAQRQALKLPYTGMAVTIDAGEWNDIHPLNKKVVGQRLALEARRVAYGETQIVSTGPQCESVKKEGRCLILTFSSVGSGIYSNLELNGFALAGLNQPFVWARAVVLSHNTIKVWSDEVADPVSVRYAWADNPVGANLRNKEGLPASPFQVMLTDN